MQLTIPDLCALVAYVVVLIAFALFMSRRRKSAEDYFLAGRGLSWWLIGTSLIATEVSLGHFLNGSAAGFETGLALAAFEWMGAVVIVLAAVFLLPKFLRAGISTVPEYLEHRYSAGTRGLMALYMMLAYVFVALAAVLYIGAAGLEAIFGQAVKDFLQTHANVNPADTLGPNWFLIASIWTLGIATGLYTLWGGLKAVVWADLLNGLVLVIGGALVTVLALVELGIAKGGAEFAWTAQLSRGVSYLLDDAGGRLSAVMPASDVHTPWFAVFIGGLWIPLLFTWGLNQSVVQRALGAKSVSQGQKGMMLAATLKLLTPLLIIVPGIIALELYGQTIAGNKVAYPHLLRHILVPGAAGLVLAALLAAVISTLDSMLNAAATIFTMDFYKRHLSKEASDRAMVRLGRLLTAVLVILACAWAPTLGWICGDKGVMDYLQKTWGFVAPGVVTVFFFGLVWRRVPAQAAAGALLLGPAVYASCLYWLPRTAFLHQMAFAFIVLSLYTLVVTILTPLGDAEEGAETDPQHPAGLLRRQVIPYLTTAIGGFLLGWPMLRLTFTLSWQIPDVPEWVNFIPAGVTIIAYVVLAMYVLRLPMPASRPVVGPARKRSAGRALGRALGYGLAGLVAAVVVGLHAYLFAAWVMPADASTGQPFWRQAYAVTTPQLSFCGGIHLEGSFDAEKTLNLRPQQGPDSDGDMTPMGGAPMGPEEPAPGDVPDAGPGAAKPKPKPEVADDAPDGDGDDAADEKAPEGETQPAEKTEAASPEAEKTEGESPEAVESDGAEAPAPVTVLLGPLVIGLVAAVLSLIAVFIVWRQPAAAEVQAAPNEKVDPASSVLAKLWGLLIVAAVVALFVRFF